jgi:hypothetical protein
MNSKESFGNLKMRSHKSRLCLEKAIGDIFDTAFIHGSLYNLSPFNAQLSVFFLDVWHETLLFRQCN